MELDRLLDSLDLAVGRASEVVDPADLAGPAEAARHARRRIGFLGESIVVALAGGTGSGKSSLLNAIAGEEVAKAGHIRPTTSQPLAWIPSQPEPGLVRLLDDMEIFDRVGHDQPTPYVIIDMPDTDSVVGTHRETFERLLPRVDAVLWVVDPEKYNDRILHHEYLQPLAGYADQFMFVVNQIDRLQPNELQAILFDFERRLADDGIHKPIVIPVAADPPGGQVEGVGHLMSLVRDRLATKNAAIAKLVTDIKEAGREVARLAGLRHGASLGYDERWAETRDQVSNMLLDLVAGPDLHAVAEREGSAVAERAACGPLGSVLVAARATVLGRVLGLVPEQAALEKSTEAWQNRPGLEAAQAKLDGFVGDLAFAAGGPFGRVLRERFDDSTLEEGVVRAVELARHRSEIDLEPPVLGWWTAVRWVKWVLAAAFVAGAVWAWAVPTSIERGSWPGPLMLMLGALLIGLLLSRLVDVSGRRQGRLLATAYRADLSESMGNALSRAVGTPLRSLLRSRAELEGALAQVALQAAEYEEILEKRN